MADLPDTSIDDWQASRTMRILDWIEAHTPGGSWPWACSWHGKGPFRGFSFHFASGSVGFFVSFPLPRWLPGFVREYQIDGPRRFWHGEVCPWWRDSDLHGYLPLLPFGWPHAGRSRRLRKRR